MLSVKLLTCEDRCFDCGKPALLDISFEETHWVDRYGGNESLCVECFYRSYPDYWELLVDLVGIPPDE